MFVATRNVQRSKRSILNVVLNQQKIKRKYLYEWFINSLQPDQMLSNYISTTTNFYIKLITYVLCEVFMKSCYAASAHDIMILKVQIRNISLIVMILYDCKCAKKMTRMHERLDYQLNILMFHCILGTYGIIVLVTFYTYLLICIFIITLLF